MSVEGVPLAIVLALVARDGGAQAAGLLIGVSTLPQLVTGPVVGRALDRAANPQRLVAVAAALASAALIVLGLSGASGWPAFVAAAALACTTPAATGGLSALVSTWAPPTARLSVLDAAGYNTAGVAAPVTVTALATVDVDWAFFALAAAGLVALPALLGAPSSGSTGQSTTSGLRPALLAIWSRPRLLAVTTSTTMFEAAIGGLTIAAAAAAAAHQRDASAAGVLVSAIAVGALVGSAAMTRGSRGFDSLGQTLLAIAGTGICLLLMSISAWPIVLALAALVGLLDAPLLIGTYEARTENSAASIRARVFTVAASLKLGASSIGAVLAGTLIADRATTAGVAVIGLVALLAAAVGYAIASHRAARSTCHC